ncbi:chromatin-remodelling complex, RSC SWI/SNF subunit Rsc7/Swp82, partial [Piptocephalis cylindrospora]
MEDDTWPKEKVDEEGEKKLADDGTLLDGRQYTFNVYTFPARHPTRLYALAVEAARAAGYRDTQHMSSSHPYIRRVISTPEERGQLVEAGRLDKRMKHRPVNLVAASSIFRAFGHRVILNGRPGEDDY